MSNENKTIRLGSGDLYIDVFNGTLPEWDALLTQIKTEEKRLGFIQGGASIEYKPEFYEASDDQGIVVKNIITKEEATLKSGILTFNGNTLEKLSETGRVSEDTVNKLRTLKIGGVGNRKGTSYIILFHHKDTVDGDVYVCIVGNNQAGFTLAFAKDKETVIDAEFKAKPMDGEGTLIMYVEEIKSAVVTPASLNVESKATKN